MMTPEERQATDWGEQDAFRDVEAIAAEMADVLLHLSVYFRLEGWERELTDEEIAIAAKIENALDNRFGDTARKAVSDAIARSTERAISKIREMRP